MSALSTSKVVLASETLAVAQEEHKPAKFLKMVADKCFGEKYQEIDQCSNCWVKKSCHIRFRNRK